MGNSTPSNARHAAQIGTLTLAATTLTNSQIKSLGSGAQIELVKAPGAGRVLMFDHADIVVDATSGGYGGFASGEDEHPAIAVAWQDGPYVSMPVGRDFTATARGATAGGDLDPLLGSDVGFARLNQRDSDWPSGWTRAYNASEGENLALVLTGANVLTAASQENDQRDAVVGDFTGGHESNWMRVLVWYSQIELGR